jgi:hypothetical protein
MNRKTAITILQLVVFIALGGGIVWYMLSHMSDADKLTMMESIADTNLAWMLPFLFCFLLGHWARARRWMLMLRPIGIHPTTANTLFAVLTGYLVNLIPPRAGEIAKCTVLARYEHMPADKMIGTIVAERAFDVLCLLAIIAGGLLWQREALGEYLTEQLRGNTPSTASILITLGVIAGIVILLTVLYRRNKASRLGRFIAGLRDGVTSIFLVRNRSMFMVYTLLIWGTYVVQLLIGFEAMKATQDLGVGPALMTLIFGSVAIIAAPGGIALYPLLVGNLLHYGYHIPEGEATAFGWVSWAGLTIATLLCGVIALILLPIYNRKPHDSVASGPEATVRNES